MLLMVGFCILGEYMAGKARWKWQEVEEEHFSASQRIPRYVLQIQMPELENGHPNAKIGAWMRMIYSLFRSYTAQLCIQPEYRSRACELGTVPPFDRPCKQASFFTKDR